MRCRNYYNKDPKRGNIDNHLYIEFALGFLHFALRGVWCTFDMGD